MNIMKNYRLITLVVFITHYALCIANTPAFPTAEGYGKYATGGRGGNVYYVTRLDDCSDDNLVEGTLRWALRSGDDTPRTVLFQVCGTIYLNTKLKLAHPNITIAGQTAPGGGICIAGANIYIYVSQTSSYAISASVQATSPTPTIPVWMWRIHAM